VPSPALSGAIHWSHQLFSRVKLTMSKLTAVEPEGTWRQMPVGQQVHERYMALAKQMMEFEKQWFQGWRENVDNIAMRHLKQPIFARHPETGEGAGVGCCSSTAHMMQQQKVTYPNIQTS
jgi:hypothetical protein